MELELRDYLRILRKRSWLIAGAIALALLVAWVYLYRADPIYEVETTLFVGQRQIPVEQLAAGVQLQQLSQQLLKSYAQIVTSRAVSEKAVERSDLRIAPRTLASSLQAEPIRDSQVIRLTYQSTDPALAQTALNAVAQAFVDEIREIDPVDAVGSMPSVRVSIIDEALFPEAPIAPRPLQTLAFALMVGLIAGSGLTFLVEQLDTRVKDRDDVERLCQAPVLVLVPKVDTGGAEVYLEESRQSIAEAFRILRTGLQFLAVEEPLRTLLVTSAFPREGKTTTALNLAAAYAHAGLSTVLVEADMRRPTLQQIFPVEGRRGLSTVLIGKDTVDSACVTTNVKRLRVIPAGATPPNPAELLGSSHMEMLLKELRDRFDMVVVDAPPLLPVADASALASRVDGVLLIAKVGATDQGALQESAGRLRKLNANLLGVVMNHATTEHGYGYRYYGYGYHADS